MKNLERLIPITIKEAKIQRIAIDYREIPLKVYVDVGLLTEDKEILTNINISNANWDKEKNLELPLSLNSIAGELEEMLQIAITQHINKYQRKIGV